MYVPESFNESRPEVLHELIMQHPLGVLVSHGEGGLDANHLPYHLKPDEGAHGVLHAHVSRANPLWRELSDGDEVLVVGHSSGAILGVSILADLIRAGVPARGPVLSFLTLGQVVPMVSFLPEARRLLACFDHPSLATAH